MNVSTMCEMMIGDSSEVPDVTKSATSAITTFRPSPAISGSSRRERHPYRLLGRIPRPC